MTNTAFTYASRQDTAFQKASRAFTIGTARIAAIGNQSFIPESRIHHAVDPINSTLAIGGINLKNGSKVRASEKLVGHGLIQKIVRTDPVTWGLVSTVRQLISLCPWSIVPDVAKHYEELARWEDMAQDSINEWGYTVEFDSQIITKEMIGRVNNEVRAIIKSKDEPRAQRRRISSLFRTLAWELEQEAVYNAESIRRTFERPNNQREKSFRALMEVILDSLLLYDAGILIKNYDAQGNIAELWSVPGYQISQIMFDDYTVPQPPDPAYVWKQKGIVKSWFNNNELTYMMSNPQPDGYGMSPVEALVYINTATILGENAYIKTLQEGFIPPGILNLKQATDPQVQRFQSTLYSQMEQFAGNRILVVGGVPSEDGEFQWQDFPKGPDFSKMQMMEYMKMAPSIKAFVFGFQASDIGLMMDKPGTVGNPEINQILSMRRGVDGPKTLVEQYINAEVVKECWPQFNNVKLHFERYNEVSTDELKAAQADSVRVAAGLRTRNEIRKRDHYRPLPGGSTATIATGNVQIPVDAFDGPDLDQIDILSLPGMNGNVAPEAPTRNNAQDRLNNNGIESRGD